MLEHDITQELDAVVPEKCRNCAVQCELSAELGKILVTKFLYEDFGEKLVGEDGQEFDRIIESTYPEDMAEEAKSNIRKVTGDSMEMIDRDIEDKRAEINANALSCSGPLKMRASKGGITYTVTVCTSNRVNTRGGQEHLPTHVRTD